MNETNIYNAMQIAIMKLNPSEMIDLLEASIKGIQKISSTTPEFAEVLRKLPNNFTNEDSKALNSLFENVKSPYLNNAIKKEDSGISLLLKGGANTPRQSSQSMVPAGPQPAAPQQAMPAGPQQAMVLPNQQQAMVLPNQQQAMVLPNQQQAMVLPNQQQGVVPIQQAAMGMVAPLIPNIANNAVTYAEAGLAPDQIFQLMQQQLSIVSTVASSENNRTLAERTEAQANLADVLTRQSNQLFGQRLSGVGFTMSVVAPGVILYKLEGLLNSIATAAVQTVGAVAATGVGAGELAVRNAPSYVFQAARASVTAAREYIPDAAFSFLQTISQGVRSSGIDAFAQTSVSGAFVERVATATATNTSSAIFVGCLLVWLALALVFVLFTAFIVKVLTGDFAAYMSLGPFGFIGIRPPQRRGGRFTRNNRQMKRHRKHKKTHKRSK